MPGKSIKLTKYFIDWEHPYDNDFAIAEEVTISRSNSKDGHRRPDVVLYVNGIAIAVLELKTWGVSVTDAIHQNIRNQQDGQIAGFFSTVQLILAGNPSALMYGVIKTPEKFWLRWKEPSGSPCPESPYSRKDYPMEMERSLLQMLEPGRLIELIHDFIIFDGGIKKIARPNQYFGLKCAQEKTKAGVGGILWHSQGSGKSLSMVWLTQWILENIPGSRVVIITDRDELDTQIEQGFTDTGKTIARAVSGSDLISLINEDKKAIICTLVHKFGLKTREKKDALATTSSSKIAKIKPLHVLLEEIRKKLPADFEPKGRIFVFVDECHRTQGGFLNKAMKYIMGDKSVLIGFTGTPLLRGDKGRLTSNENFGEYIHSYTFKEAVTDGVVLDLRYEARDIEQELKNEDRINNIFEMRTRLLSQRAKEQLQKRWATIKNLYSSKDRMEKIVGDIEYDMMRYPALCHGYGNAMLVAGSVYQAFKYWDLFEQNTTLAGKCAVISSYEPKEVDLSQGYTGEQKSEEEFKYATAKRMLGEMDVDSFETNAKEQFKKEPGTMKLLIVVDKLLTGFDAPHCTYLYIDKKMEDHNLFQAICRVNRVDDDWKEFGYIIDYQNLFEKVEKAITDYTKGAFKMYNALEIDGILKDKIDTARKDLDDAIRKVELLSEPVEHPKSVEQFCWFFCFDPRTVEPEEEPAEIIKNGNKRDDFYEAVRILVRRYAMAGTIMHELGYTDDEALIISDKVKNYDKIRRALMDRSADYVDQKQYDAMMRTLLDSYVEAKDSEVLEDLSDLSFLDFIDFDNMDDEDEEAKVKDKKVKKDNGTAETIKANVRKYIFRKKQSNPEEYEQLSARLNQIIRQMREGVLSFKQFLQSVKELITMMNGGKVDPRIDTPGKKALYDNLGRDVELALKLHSTIKAKAEKNWRTERFRGIKLRQEVQKILPPEFNIDEIMNIISHNDEY